MIFLQNYLHPVGEPGGGMVNAIVGTLILIGIGGGIGIPVGILTGTYLAEFGKNKFGAIVRFLTDVLSGDSIYCCRCCCIYIGCFANETLFGSCGRGSLGNFDDSNYNKNYRRNDQACSSII